MENHKQTIKVGNQNNTVLNLCSSVLYMCQFGFGWQHREININIKMANKACLLYRASFFDDHYKNLGEYIFCKLRVK